MIIDSCRFKNFNRRPLDCSIETRRSTMLPGTKGNLSVSSLNKNAVLLYLLSTISKLCWIREEEEISIFCNYLLNKINSKSYVYEWRSQLLRLPQTLICYASNNLPLLQRKKNLLSTVCTNFYLLRLRQTPFDSSTQSKISKYLIE